MKSKKSQFLILSITLFFILFSFIYFVESNNIYINEFREVSILNNIEKEICFVYDNTNVSDINQRMIILNNDINSFCLEIGYNCNISSNLNFTFYGKKFKKSKILTC